MLLMALLLPISMIHQDVIKGNQGEELGQLGELGWGIGGIRGDFGGRWGDVLQI